MHGVVGLLDYTNAPTRPLRDFEASRLSALRSPGVGRQCRDRLSGAHPPPRGPHSTGSRTLTSPRAGSRTCLLDDTFFAGLDTD
jgi:hypothetical protein